MNRATPPTGWVRNPDGTMGYTWNPITGCLNGCEYCYARKLANGRLRSRYLANENTVMRFADGYQATKLKVTDPFYPRFWPEKVEGYSLTNSWRCEPKGIFVCDMSDLFGIGVPEEWTRRVLDKIAHGENKLHRFYLLTKQPQNLIKWSPFPDNCWVGVSATNAEQYYDAVSHIASIEAKVKFVSFEPLLDCINGGECTEEMRLDSIDEFDWVIIGAQTKPYKPPKWEWVSEIIEACVKAGIPYFLKNNLEPIVPKVFGGDGNLIQEMPV